MLKNENEKDSTIFCNPKEQKNDPASFSERRRLHGFDDQAIFDEERLVSELTVAEFKKILRQYILRYSDI